MKKLLLLVVGVIIGVTAYWFLTQPHPRPPMADTRERAHDTATNVIRTLKDNFDANAIKEELARTGRVIREKTAKAGDAFADAAADTRISASIKAKLVQDVGLAAFKIDVDTTDGRVTLSGTVASHEEIARAMKLAFETEGVRGVISTLQVKPGTSGA
jgi:osmotically-inducible protein OsmY